MRPIRPGLTLGALVLFLAAAPLLAVDPDWSYRYYKDTVELTFYPYEIALYDPTPPVTLLPGNRQVLLPNGDVATADDLAGGWSVVSLSIPGAEDPVAYTTGLAALLLARDGLFLDNFESGDTSRWTSTAAGV